ncbi:MAG: twin-arginine translocase TatA/TatE family subunit [Actinobacteria bacterium]|nr:twin-arginine translocase TatA/TatE family subunit [Actinomycetota bacterium]
METHERSRERSTCRPTGTRRSRSPRGPTTDGLTQNESEQHVPNVGPPEILILLVVGFMLFGAKRLPEMGRALGQSIRGFKETVTAVRSDDPPQSS